MKSRLPLAMLCLVLAVVTWRSTPLRAQARHSVFNPGDMFISLQDGSVQWRNPDGTPNAVIVGNVPGNAEGMQFDASGNLYVTHWCANNTCSTGNTTERFDKTGTSLGTFGSGYNCNPHALVFDKSGNAYVGQADCDGSVLKFSMGQAPTEYFVAPENRGAFWVDLAADGCTLFYTSWGPDVKRFNVCTGTQLANFNTSSFPSGVTQALKILSDGGLLVSSGPVISRLDSTGTIIQTYSVSGMSQYWAGLDLVGDGTFWAINYYTSDVFQFNLATGAIVATFNTGTPPETAVDLRLVPRTDFDIPIAADFDGDGKTDISVFRPSTGQWFINQSSSGYRSVAWGESGDIPVSADFDGDGKADVAVFRPSTGEWFIDGSSAGYMHFNWGQNGDIPVPRDFDGDRKADVAVYRPSTGQWFILGSSSGYMTVAWGESGDIPLAADFDGDGKADVAVFRPSTGQWFILGSSSGYMTVGWGESGDIPLAADFDGDGKADVAVFRPSTGQWFILGSSSGYMNVAWGENGDIPLAADFDGDRKADIAVFRPSTGVWYVQHFWGGGYASIAWGY